MSIVCIPNILPASVPVMHLSLDRDGVMTFTEVLRSLGQVICHGNA